MGSSERRLIALPAAPATRFAAAATRAWEAGDAVLPYDPRSPRPALERLFAAARPAVVVADGDEASFAAAAPVAGGVAAVLATSGSEGIPKCVELTHGALSAAADAVHERLGATGEDVWICPLPLAHIAGFAILARAARLGTAPVLLDRFDEDSVMRSEGTLLAVVPTMLARMLDAGMSLARFSTILVGGACLPHALRARAEAAEGRVVETYGMTETCGGVVHDGRPLRPVEATISEDGRVLLRGPMLMRGYRLRPDATAAAVREGWFETSDVGEIRAGRLRILGRADDAVITAGRKVFPEEVEAVLRAHDHIADAAVYGLPDPERGHIVAAAIVPRGGAPSIDELRTFVSEHLEAYKAPGEVRIVDRIPVTTSGKPDRRAFTRSL